MTKEGVEEDGLTGWDYVGGEVGLCGRGYVHDRTQASRLSLLGEAVCTKHADDLSHSPSGN